MCARRPSTRSRQRSVSIRTKPSAFDRRLHPLRQSRSERVRLRADWNEVRVDVMRAVLAAKFSDLELRARLIATGTAELVEENTWNDRFWGRSR